MGYQSRVVGVTRLRKWTVVPPNDHGTRGYEETLQGQNTESRVQDKIISVTPHVNRY